MLRPLKFENKISKLYRVFSILLCKFFYQKQKQYQGENLRSINTQFVWPNGKVTAKDGLTNSGDSNSGEVECSREFPRFQRMFIEWPLVFVKNPDKLIDIFLTDVVFVRDVPVHLL